MPPRLRRFVLTAHITASVGWLGAVGCFLALAVVGLTSQDPQTVRGAYLVMEPAARSLRPPHTTEGRSPAPRRAASGIPA
jgi:hypothetical protein